MKLAIALLLIIVIAMIIKARVFSFRGQSPEDYADSGPPFMLKEHLSGEILAEGLIYGPNGKMTNSFTAAMYGEWSGETGTLTEDFTYSNGAKQQRKWFLKKGPGNTFTATADDIIGEAKGTVSGATIKMTYKIVLPKDAGGHTLTVTDWLYRTENGIILNKSEMRKFGIKVAELVATMRPVNAMQAQEAAE